MIVHKWGVIEYEKARQKMETVHLLAQSDGQNHLILTQHPRCFTIGRDAWQKQWSVPTIRSDRGGSITCHSEGQNIFYFCFQTPSPVRFFRQIRIVFQNFFNTFDKEIIYLKKNPGFYIKNKKLCSLGFRYKNGVSLHGIALNVNVNLAYHSQINPCNIEGIIPTSLVAEGIFMECVEVNNHILLHIAKVFDESF